MALPIRGLSARSDRRGRSSSSERSSRSFRWSRSRSNSKGRVSESERSTTSNQDTSRSRRFNRRRRRDDTDRKKDALLKNYGNFLSRRGADRTPSYGSHPSRDSRSNRPSYDPSRPFLIPPSQTLAPRCDVWFVLAITSCAAVSSCAQIKTSSFGLSDKFALSVCAISFIVSSICSVGIRYAPFRNGFCSPNTGRPKNLIQALLKGMNITPEICMLIFLSVMWLAGISVIVNGSVQHVTLAVSGSEIWNANLFYSSWISTLLTWYLLVELMTLKDRNGVVPRYPEPSSTYRGWQSNALSKRWILVSLVSVIILSSTLRMYSGPNCAGILKSTDYCSRSLVGVILGGFFQLLMCCGVFFMYRLSNMRDYSHVLDISKKNKSTFGISLISLLIQSINVGVLTSPTGGGPGSVSGTVYFSSWAGFVLLFEMCLRYVEFFSTYGADSMRVMDDPRPLVLQDVPERISGSRSSREKVRRGKSSGTASMSSDGEEHPVILQIEAPPPSMPALPPPQYGHVEDVSEASPSQLHSGHQHPQKEPQEVFSVGSAPRLEPEESTSGNSSKVRRDAFSRSTANESGKSPEGYYLDNIAFSQQTSFRADKMEDMDQSRPSINYAPKRAARRSKSPQANNSKQLPSLTELSNEKSTPSTRSPMSMEEKVSRPKTRTSSRQSNRPNSKEWALSSSDSQDPPPTISEDDLGDHTTISEYIQRSKPVAESSQRPRSQTGTKNSGRSESRSRGPPPPPFHRTETDRFSIGSAIPLQSVSAYTNTQFDVSEPTLDAPLEEPTAQEMARFSMPMPKDGNFKESASNNSYEYGKKWSDSTGGAENTIQRSSSDDNPSSEGGNPDKDQVDDIVAAALAYAEKSHADDGIRSTSSSGLGKKPSTLHDESIHSFYSRSQGQSQGPPDHSVNDMVANALSQAGKQVAQAKEATSRRADSSMYSEYSDTSGVDSKFEGQFNC